MALLARRLIVIPLCGLVAAAVWLARGAPLAGPRLVPFASAVPHVPSPAPSPAPPEASRPKKARATVAFVGDVSMASAIAARIERGEEPGFPFAAVAEKLRRYDLLVGNLECVVATQGRAAIPEPLIAPLQTPRLLLDAGFDLVSIANNHTLDLSAQGYFEMLGHLDEAGLVYFGVTAADTTRDPFVVREVAGVRVAMVGHVDRGAAQSLRDVARAREKADVVVVFVHWGIEYDLMPTRYQREYSRALVDAGADAVVAAHAHVVQPAERYRGRLIAHGIGNFVFSGMTRRGSHTGALLELDIGEGGIVGHRFSRVTIDDRGAPAIVGEPSEDPPFDPPGPRPLPPF